MSDVDLKIESLEKYLEHLNSLFSDPRFTAQLDDDALAGLLAEKGLADKGWPLDKWREYAGALERCESLAMDVQFELEDLRGERYQRKQRRKQRARHADPPAHPLSTPPPRKPRVRSFDDVQPLATGWIWPHRVARGWLTLVAGESGAGKSLVLIDLISRVSRGRPFPVGDVPRADDETKAARSPAAGIPATVLLLTRDGLENVVHPRLTAAGADMKRVRFMCDFPATDGEGNPVTRAFELENDLAAVEEFLAEDPSIALVVIDPCWLSPDLRHRGFTQKTRETLVALRELARRRQVAVVVAATIENVATGSALRRWLDKLLAITEDDFVLAVVRDQRRGARRLLLTLRSPLGDTEDGRRFETPGGRVVWGRGGISAQALYATAGRLDQQDAAVWLRGELAFHPVPGKELRAAANAAGIPWHVIYRATSIAGAECCRKGFGRGSQIFWSLPKPQNDERDESPPTVPVASGQEIGSQPQGQPQGGTPAPQCSLQRDIGTGPQPSHEDEKSREFTIENKKASQAERERDCTDRDSAGKDTADRERAGRDDTGRGEWRAETQLIGPPGAVRRAENKNTAGESGVKNQEPAAERRSSPADYRQPKVEKLIADEVTHG